MNSSSFNTLVIGKFFIKLNEIDSTNNFLRDLIANNRPTDGTVILADRQIAGRGQRGTSWNSEPNLNITMSVLIHPTNISVQNQFVISAMTALSVYDLIRELLPDKKTEVKWPNDVMIDREKVCGILIENTIRGSTIQNSILGIGLNVFQKIFIGNIRATSLSLKGFEGEYSYVLKRLIEFLDKNYLALKQGRESLIMERYHKVLLGYGEELDFRDSDGKFRGVIQKVHTDGRIEILTSKRIQSFYHKEVKFLL